MSTDVEQYRQSIYAAIEAAGPTVFPEIYAALGVAEPDAPPVENLGEVEESSPAASSSSSGTVSEKFHRFLAEQREQTGAMDHPKFYRQGTTSA